MDREATTFFEHLAQVGFEDGQIPAAHQAAFKALMERLVEILQETIASIDFWTNADKQKRVRGMLKTVISATGIEELKSKRERMAVEVMKLAKNRHDALIRARQVQEP